MRIIVRVGRPTHYRPDNRKLTACGYVGLPEEFMAYDPRDVDCLRCRRTKKFKKRFDK